MSVQRPPDFDDVDDVLTLAGTQTGAAESHGLLSGLVCASGVADQKILVREVFEAYDPADKAQSTALGALQSLYAEVQSELNSTELDFHLLLPEDLASLRERTEALANWCQGFLLGLGMGGMPKEQNLSADVRELLQDFSHIANVDFELDEHEEEQAAFEEVAEYLRIGVLVIYEALQPGREAAPETLQ